MSRASALARGQAAAELGMVDACTIRRGGAPVLDDFSGTSTPGWTALYAGKCRVQQGIAQADEQETGEDYQLRLRLVIQLPLTVVGLKVSDEITITAAGHDPDLVGRVFVIRDLFHKTHPTARRVGVVERTGS
jgi:hypothetical protein